MKPPNNAKGGPVSEAARRKTPAKVFNFSEAVKKGRFFVDIDNASVAAFAIEVGEYARMTGHIRCNAPNGPLYAVVAGRCRGMAVVLCLGGGFAEAEDNGWVALLKPDGPGAFEDLIGALRPYLVGEPHLLEPSAAEWN